MSEISLSEKCICQKCKVELNSTEIKYNCIDCKEFITFNLCKSCFADSSEFFKNHLKDFGHELVKFLINVLR